MSDDGQHNCVEMCSTCVEKNELEPSVLSSEELLRTQEHENTTQGDYFFDEDEFPVDALPSGLYRYANDAAELFSCGPGHVFTACLSILSVLIGNSRVVGFGDWWEAAVVWAALVGEPGSMKSPILKAVTAPIVEMQRKAYNEFAASQEAYESAKEEYDLSSKVYKEERKRFLKAQMNGEDGTFDVQEPVPPERPSFDRTTCGDTTTEALADVLAINRRGILVNSDELSGWMESMGQYKKNSADVSRWLELWNAGTLEVDRKLSGYLRVGRAFVSILGGIQPKVLCRLFSGKNVDNGLTSRFLFSFPYDQPVIFRQDGIPQESKTYWFNLCWGLKNLIRQGFEEGEPKPVPITLDWLAREEFAGIFETIEQVRTADNIPDDEKHFVAKMRGYVLRIALILHLVKRFENETLGSETKVDVNSVRSAWRIMQWYHRQTQKTYDSFTTLAVNERSHPMSKELVEKVFKHFLSMEAKGMPVTARSLRNGYRNEFKSQHEALLVLNTLATLGRAKPVTNGKQAAFLWSH